MQVRESRGCDLPVPDLSYDTDPPRRDVERPTRNHVIRLLRLLDSVGWEGSLDECEAVIPDVILCWSVDHIRCCTGECAVAWSRDDRKG